MDDKTRVELYKRASHKLEGAMESLKYQFDALAGLASSLETIFYLLYIANKDIEDAVAIDVE